jgi:hypothetical protein
MVGFHIFGNLVLINAFLSCQHDPDGQGSVDRPDTTGGRLFPVFRKLFLAFAGVLWTPLYYRFCTNFIRTSSSIHRMTCSFHIYFESSMRYR